MSKTTTIFLTGFPGFIAERLVEKLASPDRQILLLVQPQFVKRSTERVNEIAERIGMPVENFVLIEGDITRPDLGMSGDDVDHVLNTATDVFHLAAIYDLAVAKEPAF